MTALEIVVLCGLGALALIGIVGSLRLGGKNVEWKDPYKREVINIRSVNIYPGQALTLWMNMRRESEEREAVQVELRVTPSGRVEIFTTLSRVQILDLDEWTDEPAADRTIAEAEAREKEGA